MRHLKMFLAVAVLFGFAVRCHAGELREGVPVGELNSLATADYGGVSVPTFTFSGTLGKNTLYIPGPSTVYGAIFSSAQPNVNSFITFWTIEKSTWTALYTSTSPRSESFRLYVDLSSSTSDGIVSGINGTIAKLPLPLFNETGWLVTSSAVVINSICIPFHRHKQGY